MTTALDDLATDLAFGIGRHWCGPLPPEHYDGSTRSRLNGTTNSILVLLTSGGGFTDVSLTPKTAPNVDLGDRYLNRVWSRPDLPDDEHERALLERLREIVDHHTEAHPGQPTTAVMGWYITDVLAMIHRHYELRLPDRAYPDADVDLAPNLAAAFAARWAEYCHSHGTERTTPSHPG